MATSRQCREQIRAGARGIHLDPNEIFISDGSKSDTGNIQELVRWDNSIGVTDPIYPVYIDSNAMIGRAGLVDDSGRWSNVVYMPCNEAYIVIF